MKKCPKCENTDIDTGQLISGGEGVRTISLGLASNSPMYRSDSENKLTTLGKERSPKCYVCTNCGYMEMYYQNPQQFKKK